MPDPRSRANGFCHVCGKRITNNRRISYCSDSCATIGEKLNDKKRNKEDYERRKKQREEAKRLKEEQTAPVPMPLGSIDKRFAYFCEKYNVLLSAEMCSKRQKSASAGKRMIDVFCCDTCRGKLLRPSTKEEVSLHYEKIDMCRETYTAPIPRLPYYQIARARPQVSF